MDLGIYGSEVSHCSKRAEDRWNWSTHRWTRTSGAERAWAAWKNTRDQGLEAKSSIGYQYHSQQSTRSRNQKKLATREKKQPNAGAVPQPARKKQQDFFIEIKLQKMNKCQWNFFLKELSELSIETNTRGMHFWHCGLVWFWFFNF